MAELSRRRVSPLKKFLALLCDEIATPDLVRMKFLADFTAATREKIENPFDFMRELFAQDYITEDPLDLEALIDILEGSPALQQKVRTFVKEQSSKDNICQISRGDDETSSRPGAAGDGYQRTPLRDRSMSSRRSDSDSRLSGAGDQSTPSPSDSGNALTLLHSSSDPGPSSTESTDKSLLLTSSLSSPSRFPQRSQSFPTQTTSTDRAICQMMQQHAANQDPRDNDPSSLTYDAIDRETKRKDDNLIESPTSSCISSDERSSKSETTESEESGFCDENETKQKRIYYDVSSNSEATESEASEICDENETKRKCIYYDEYRDKNEDLNGCLDSLSLSTSSSSFNQKATRLKTQDDADDLNLNHLPVEVVDADGLAEIDGDSDVEQTLQHVVSSDVLSSTHLKELASDADVPCVNALMNELSAMPKSKNRVLGNDCGETSKSAISDNITSSSKSKISRVPTPMMSSDSMKIYQRDDQHDDDDHISPFACALGLISNPPNQAKEGSIRTSKATEITEKNSERSKESKDLLVFLPTAAAAKKDQIPITKCNTSKQAPSSGPSRVNRSEYLDELPEVDQTYSTLKKRLGSNVKLTSIPFIPVELYDYQLELAKPGLEGHNCIICAPTGSGKTFTAAYVCKRRREIALGRREETGVAVGGVVEKRRFKALFVVCIRNLIQQQRDAICRIITEENAVVSINETMLLSEAMNRADVIVLTAQILVNCLNNNEVNVTDFNLIMIDECHHTDLKHPYNVIMQFYHKALWSGEKTLPQIVGLTASLGVGGADESTAALLHYIRLCANLNAQSVTHVKDPEHMNELLRHNPRPKKDQIVAVESRPSDHPFTVSLISMMVKLEGMSSPPLPAPPFARSSQPYENWVVSRRMEAETSGSTDMIMTTSALNRFNVALMIYDDFQAKDALDVLDSYFNDDYMMSNPPITIRGDISSLYENMRPTLQSIADEEQVSDNNKLDKLRTLLTDLYAGDGNDARGILLTRTRQGVDALLRFISEQNDLKDCVFPAKLVGQGAKEGAMTDKEQEQTLRRFKMGRPLDRERSDGVNLLVATDVAQEGLDMPKCSFVIRYNFVSNEIGSVQSRGRARAPNSECYLIVNRGSVNQERELKNLEKEYLMMQALDDIDQMLPEKLREQITQGQDRIRQEWEITKKRQEVKKMLCDASRVLIHCRQCYAEICRGTDVHLLGSNYICVAKDFIKKDGIPGKAVMRKSGNITEFRLDSHIGECCCVGCNQKLGPEIRYKHGPRLHGHALSKDGVCWRYDDQAEFQAIRKWSKVPFPITEEKLF